MKKTLVIIAGPTASGKTTLAIKLAQHYQTEIISADSRQLYRELTIGTAKPNVEELASAKHHFINSQSIIEEYNAGKFEEDALALLDKLFAKKDIVIMAGGSGMYIRAVTHGFDRMPEVNTGIRDNLNKMYQANGLTWLQNRVEETDPDYYEQADKNNPQRLIRSLEVFQASGIPYSRFRKKEMPERQFETTFIGLDLPRDVLYERINQRVAHMMEEGLMEEVKSLMSFRHLNALATVGYQELFRHLDGELTLDEAIVLIKKNTRHYARRQLTWFRNEDGINWFHPDPVDEIIAHIKAQIS